LKGSTAFIRKALMLLDKIVANQKQGGVTVIKNGSEVKEVIIL
jgi:hypothetical protein